MDLDEATEIAKYLTQEVGMWLHGTFSSGAPGETEEEIRETAKYIKWFCSLPNTTKQWSGMAPAEGTPLWTLRDRGSLEKYPEAIIDDNFDFDTDGQHKIEQLKKEMNL